MKYFENILFKTFTFFSIVLFYKIGNIQIRQEKILIINKKTLVRHFLCWDKGFTFIELIVVMTIIVIMTGAIGFSLNGINSNTRLSNAANHALADVRYAQEMAMTHRREVDIYVNAESDYYEVKWHDNGSYIPSSLNANNLIVNFNQGEYEDINIASSGLEGRLSFTSTGAPLINGSNFDTPRSVMHLNSKIHVVIYSSGYSCLEEPVGSGAGC